MEPDRLMPPPLHRPLFSVGNQKQMSPLDVLMGLKGGTRTCWCGPFNLDVTSPCEKNVPERVNWVLSTWNTHQVLCGDGPPGAAGPHHHTRQSAFHVVQAVCQSEDGHDLTGYGDVEPRLDSRGESMNNWSQPPTDAMAWDQPGINTHPTVQKEFTQSMSGSDWTGQGSF